MTYCSADSVFYEEKSGEKLCHVDIVRTAHRVCNKQFDVIRYKGWNNPSSAIPLYYLLGCVLVHYV
jgi:hypothetical protein